MTRGWLVSPLTNQVRISVGMTVSELSANKVCKMIRVFRVANRTSPRVLAIKSA